MPYYWGSHPIQSVTHGNQPYPCNFTRKQVNSYNSGLREIFVTNDGKLMVKFDFKSMRTLILFSALVLIPAGALAADTSYKAPRAADGIHPDLNGIWQVLNEANYDLEIQFPFGIVEVIGLAYRTDYDLLKHQEKSKTKNTEHTLSS